jgi:phospholipid/cholesterol/gamma-HCH transport system substrate-binding protein
MDQHDDGLHPAWWTLLLVVLLGVAFWLTYSLFLGTFKATETVTLTSDRSGLVMETNARVKLRGVQVGRVASIQGGSEPVALKLEIDRDKIKYIPANVEARSGPPRFSAPSSSISSTPATPARSGWRPDR